MKKYRVLIIDDSALVRNALTHIIEKDSELEVMGTASDPYFAAEKIKKEVPDVITLDMEMPRMDGLTFLRTLMSQRPIPVVVISSLTQKGAETAMKALEYGAVEILQKPQLYGTHEFLEENHLMLCQAIKAAAMAKISRISGKNSKTAIQEKTFAPVEKKYSADVIINKQRAGSSLTTTTDKVIAIGASTGGTEAIKLVLENLPTSIAGIVIVQHMPEHFTRSFAQRLDGLCAISVKEAVHGDQVQKGQALIAPGNQHLLLHRRGARYIVELRDGPLVNRHRPSVDVLFRSVAQAAGQNSIGVLLTGMGADGAIGLQEMKAAGARTIAQDEQSSIVFGMPAAAIKLNAADEILPLNRIPEYLKMLTK